MNQDGGRHWRALVRVPACEVSLRQSPSSRLAPVFLVQPLLALPARWGVPEAFIMSSDGYQVQASGCDEVLSSPLIRNPISFCVWSFHNRCVTENGTKWKRQNRKSLTWPASLPSRC